MCDVRVCAADIAIAHSDFLAHDRRKFMNKNELYFPMQQATEKWSSSDSKNRAKVENHLSTTSNLNLNGFGNAPERQKSAKNIGQEVIELISDISSSFLFFFHSLLDAIAVSNG